MGLGSSIHSCLPQLLPGTCRLIGLCSVGQASQVALVMAGHRGTADFLSDATKWGLHGPGLITYDRHWRERKRRNPVQKAFLSPEFFRSYLALPQPPSSGCSFQQICCILRFLSWQVWGLRSPVKSMAPTPLLVVLCPLH